MAQKLWYEEVVADDMLDVDTWNDMIEYIKHNKSCDFVIYTNEPPNTTQAFKLYVSGTHSIIEGKSSSYSDLTLKANSSNDYPYIDLLGNTSVEIYAKTSVNLYKETTKMLSVDYSSNTTTLAGGSSSGDKLTLDANSTDTYPYINLIGDNNVEIYTKSTLDLYKETTKMLSVDYSTDTTTITGSDISADKLILKASSSTYPYIMLSGGSKIDIYSSSTIDLYEQTTKIASFSYSSNETTITGGTASENKLTLKANSYDTYPYINLTGDGALALYSSSTIDLYKSATKSLSIDYSSGSTTITGSTSTTNSLTLKANSVDAYSSIILEGNSDIALNSKYSILFNSDGVRLFLFDKTTNTSLLIGQESTGKILKIKATSDDDYPYINMTGASSIDLYSHTSTNIYTGVTRLLTIDLDSNITRLIGQSTSGRTLILKATSSDTYPYVSLIGNGALGLYSSSTIDIYKSATKVLTVDYTSSTTTVVGSGTSGDALTLKANTSNSYPYIKLIGNGATEIYSSSTIDLYSSSTKYITFSYSSSVSSITTPSNVDLSLNVQGTGKINFNSKQSINFVIENRTSDPSSPATGQIWIRTDL